MAAHLLTLDGYQSEQLRAEADDRNQTISAYVAQVLVDCEIIPVATPTTEELVTLACDIADGKQVHDRARVTRWFRVEQDRLRSQLLAISTGLQVIETGTMGSIVVDLPDHEPVEPIEPIEPVVIEAIEPTEAAEATDPEATEPEAPIDPEVIEPTENEAIDHWISTWLPGDPTPESKHRRRPGGPQVLDPDDVRAIRRQIASGRLTQREIAQAFGCSRSNISKILNGRSWAGLADDED